MLSIFRILAAVANAYAPPLSRTKKAHWPEQLRAKRPDAVRQAAAQAKRERRWQRNLRNLGR